MDVREWEIENISCWNAEIHGEKIKCGGAYLYPRGVGGHSDYLEVIYPHDCGVVCYHPTLVFIASDGSIIPTRKVGFLREEIGFSYFGPTFKEVVNRIKGHEHLHKDRLILRWQSSSFTSEKSVFYRSVICAFDTSMEMDSRFFDNLKIEDWQQISVIESHSDFKCVVLACKASSSMEILKFKIILDTAINGGKLLVRTSFSTSKAETLTKRFAEDFILNKQEERILSFRQPEKDANQKIFLTFKIITGTTEWFYHSSNCPLNMEKDVSDLPNALIYEEEETAVTVFSKDIMGLYNDHEFSDFELRCGTVSFPTHRNILSARSAVFKAMLSGDMKEVASGHVDVEDLDPHTLSRFLTFLYSGATGGDAMGWEEASKLYYAADKYQVPSLTSECLSVLRASVSLENVCDILALGDRHQDEELTSTARDFILMNYNTVLGSEEWERFSNENPSLLLKTLTYFAESKRVIPNITE